MFITSNSYQDLQGLCLEYFTSPFKLFMTVKALQVHFSTDVFRSAGKGEVKLYNLCALVLTLCMCLTQCWHAGAAQHSFVKWITVCE